MFIILKNKLFFVRKIFNFINCIFRFVKDLKFKQYHSIIFFIYILIKYQTSPNLFQLFQIFFYPFYLSQYYYRPIQALRLILFMILSHPDQYLYSIFINESVKQLTQSDSVYTSILVNNTFHKSIYRELPPNTNG